MADDSILTPGDQEINDAPIEPTPTTVYLNKDKYLSEFQTEEDKDRVRFNLHVPSIDQIYSKDKIDEKLSETTKKVIEEHLSMEDPHGIIPEVEGMIENMVKVDGSTPFIFPQAGIDPEADNHLTTKKFVSRLLKNHINTDDPHHLLPQVIRILQDYPKKNQVYSKSQIYTKDEIEQKDGKFIKKDGTVPFTKPQVGIDPTIDSHLVTKRYADNLLRNHLIQVDPHGFFTILNNRLASYAKKKDFYDKTQTYSRTQIDTIITSIVNQAIDASIQEYIDSINDKLEYIRKQDYVKSDGSTSFLNPQKGVDAVEEDDLVTLRQLEEKINDKRNVWITSGPVQSTVGHVEDNSNVPEQMTFQEIMDAIFYGAKISLTVSDYVTITKTTSITACINGSIGLLDHAELQQNGEVIYMFTKEDFTDGCVTVDSLPITEDTEITFKVYYTNDTMREESKSIKCGFPVFVGLLPKWKFGYTITMDYLIELSKTGSNNEFLDQPKELNSFTFSYDFKDPELQHPFVVIPADYPDLDSMVTQSQSFGIDAFDVIDMIPLTIPGINKDVIYKVYIYRQALSSLKQDVTFNFK